MWSSQPRPAMPAGWTRTRNRVLRQSDVCYICGQPGADEVDHVIPRHRGGGEAASNLHPVHRACHARKSSSEGNRRKAELKARKKRPTEHHPGMC